MRKILIYICLAAITLTIMSCRTEERIVDDLNIPGLGGYDYETTELDKWLDETFRKPYNIKVYYRWDAVQQLNIFSRQLVPAKVDNIKPMMSALARVWFEPFLFSSGYGFLQNACPKTIVLTGSPEYGTDGTMTMGQAEGARKIWLTNVNDFDPKNADKVKTSLHVIEHEFMHVLNQLKKYDKKYADISSEKYLGSSWTNIKKNPDANGIGFITPYAANNPDEDFAEMFSNIVIYGQDWFESTVIANASNPANGPNPEKAVSDLREKVIILEKYLDTQWGITLFDKPDGKTGLTTRVQEAMNDLLNN